MQQHHTVSKMTKEKYRPTKQLYCF